MSRVLCDLHNHSCLSPCGSLEQSPRVLVEKAAARGIGLLALSDHNAALNCPAFAVAARRAGIAALYGVEATSAEEVHVLCLFARVPDALAFGAFLAERTPTLPYDAAALGDQVVVDDEETIVEIVEDRWLCAATELDFEALCAEAAGRGALVIPAHIDRPAFGALAQLGFLPEGPYPAVEVLRRLDPRLALGRTQITGSDAHWPEHIGRRAFVLDLEEPWQEADGSVRLGQIEAALRAGKVGIAG